MNNTQIVVKRFLQYFTERDLNNIIMLFSENIDWYIPGNIEKAPWLGKRKNRHEVSEFYQMLWRNTEPVSATIDDIFINDRNAVIAGEFSTRMLRTGKMVNSLFFILMTVGNGQITKYRLLEDSYAVSIALG